MKQSLKQLEGPQADTEEHDQANSQHHIKEGRSDNGISTAGEERKTGQERIMCCHNEREVKTNKTKTTHWQQSCALPVGLGWFQASGNSMR